VLVVSGFRFRGGGCLRGPLQGESQAGAGKKRRGGARPGQGRAGQGRVLVGGPLGQLFYARNAQRPVGDEE
jgi:hypothetical protein